MSEDRDTYGENKKELCPKCGTVIGVRVMSDGKYRILIRGVQHLAADLICPKCGQEWHWRPTDVKLEKLIERIVLR